MKTVLHEGLRNRIFTSSETVFTMCFTEIESVLVVKHHWFAHRNIGFSDFVHRLNPIVSTTGLLIEK
jgi:hypothetical protein